MTFCLKMKSDYSFLSSTITFDDAISFCKQNRSNYLSLIDTNLHGALQFYNLCILHHIQPILGVELKIKYNDTIYPLIFIAKSERGYKNLSRLTSLAYQYQKDSLEFKHLSLYTQDIALIISSEDSYLANLIHENHLFEANSFIDDVKTIFKEYYFGIYRYKGFDEKKMQKIKEYANQANIVCLAMQYATHKNEKDTLILNLLDCIKNNIPANKNFLNQPSIKEAYLKNDELMNIYYDRDELDNLMKFASTIHLKINKVEFSLPEVFLNQDANEKLKELTYLGLKEKELEQNTKYIERVEMELKTINSMGFSNYYLVVADYVNYAKSHDIPVGPARGSGAASLVAYLLNITTIDPIKYNLLFERFLNPFRVNYPDFDIDFADNKREEIIQYVKEKYGYQHVCYIATFATFGPKSAIRDLARILKISNDDVDYIVKNMSINCISINDEYKNNKKFKDLLDIHGNFKTLCGLASQIEGLKKQLGLHAAGMILSSEKMDEIVPCFEPAFNTLAIQYDYKDAEKIGLIKMDFLGLKNLSIIDYCFKKMSLLDQKEYTISNYDFNQVNAYQMIASGSTMGIFQLESEGMNHVIAKLKPNCFDDIVALLALYRPGPMDMIQTYIDRKHGQAFQYLDESLKDILEPTYGIIVYQEQIMQICQKVAHFDLGEADILRRAISKKNLNLIQSEKEKFIQGCLQNQFSKEKALQLFSFIEKFASYGFNKAHSVGYATIATTMACIKANDPALFYEALLNVNQETGERRRKILYEAKKNHIEIIKPSVQDSSYRFTSQGNTLQFGLANIQNIKDKIAQMIIEERQKAQFIDLYDFIIRMVLNDLSMQVLSDLTFAGALDCFKINRKKIIKNLSKLYDYALMFKGLEYQPNTYQDERYQFISAPLLIFEDTETDFLKKEYEMLGIYLSTHPLRKIKEKTLKTVIDLNAIIEDGHYDIVGKITLIEVKKTKENKDYLHLNIEDDTEKISVNEYKNPLFYKDNFHKNDLIMANITFKNYHYYLNNAQKIEVNNDEKDTTY